MNPEQAYGAVFLLGIVVGYIAAMMTLGTFYKRLMGTVIEEIHKKYKYALGVKHGRKHDEQRTQGD